MKHLWNLFWLFFKIGLFTFGGGLAMLPLLKAEFVDKRRFLSEEELTDLYSVGQCTPGIIVVNVVTFIGYKQRGISGAIAATLGAVTPSLVIITLIASVLRNIADNPYVIHAFSGIRLCVLALITSMTYDMAKKTLTGWFSAAFFATILILLVFCNLSVTAAVIFAAFASLSISEFKRRLKK